MKTIWPAYRHGSILLTSLALMTSPLVGQSPLQVQSNRGRTPSEVANGGAGASAAPASLIAGVDLTNDGQRTCVRIKANGQLNYHVSRIQNPDRLVLDFQGARLAAGNITIPSETAPVRSVRLGQFKPEIARVVIDVDGAASFSIDREEKGLVVVFGSTAQAPINNVAIKQAAHYRFIEGPLTASRPNVSRPSQAVPVAIPKIDLPVELTQASASFASLGGSRQPRIPPAPQAFAANGTQQQSTTTAQPGNTPSPNGTKYTGEPLSVNLKAVDLVDFFRLITEVSGLNVVIDPAVKGSLTLVLNEVPWDQALDIVLQNNGLDKQLTGNVLRIATKETLKREADTQTELIKSQSNAIDLVTVTRVLSYAKATTMKETLKQYLTGRGNLIADERSNTLIIHDIPQVIPPIENLIRLLDKKSQQVEIEARVVSATRDFARDIGVQLGFSGAATDRSIFSGNPGVGISSGPTGTPAPPLVGGPTPTPNLNPLAGALPLAMNLGAAAATGGIGFFHRSPNFALDFFISAAESKGIGKLLSKPKLTAQNNEKATVKQGVKIPVQTIINNTITVQYVDAVLKLEVTPQITGDGTIFMDVLVENTQIDNGIPRVQGIPALDTQSVESKVLVADGATMVIGGVIVSQQRTDITQVPLIGSLPLIGHLFRRENVHNTSTELLFFLTPRITPG